MKNIVWIIVPAILIYYMFSNYIETEEQREDNTSSINKNNIEKKKYLNQLAKKFGALDNWENTLSNGKTFRLQNIMTLELERLWIGEQPILFNGYINDVSTFNNTHYKISIVRSFTPEVIFTSNLMLSLLIEKSIFDSLILKKMKLSELSLFDNSYEMTLIAKIIKIDSKKFIDSEGVMQEYKIGVGEALDLINIGNLNYDTKNP